MPAAKGPPAQLHLQGLPLVPRHERERGDQRPGVQDPRAAADRMNLDFCHFIIKLHERSQGGQRTGARQQAAREKRKGTRSNH